MLDESSREFLNRPFVTGPPFQVSKSAAPAPLSFSCTPRSILHVIIHRSVIGLHCDFFSPLAAPLAFFAATSSLRFLMAVSTCHMARSSSTSS